MKTLDLFIRARMLLSISAGPASKSLVDRVYPFYSNLLKAEEIMICGRLSLCALSGASFLALGLAVLPAHGQSFTNGSFEADNWMTGGGPVLNLDDPGGITGWTAVDAPPTSLYFFEGWNNANGAGLTPFGNQFLALGEEGLGGNYVEQTVAGFTPGTSYSLTFSIASETMLGQAGLRVLFPSGSATPAADFLAPLATASSWDTWQTFAYMFTPDAAAVTFRFQDTSDSGNTALGLDNISVAAVPRVTPLAVPEPGSLALLLAGGALLVRRRRGA